MGYRYVFQDSRGKLGGGSPLLSLRKLAPLLDKPEPAATTDNLPDKPTESQSTNTQQSVTDTSTTITATSVSPTSHQGAVKSTPTTPIAETPLTPE